MLALSYVALRFIHFAALMLLFGNALYSVWFAPSSLQRLMTRRFQRQQKLAALISLMAALLMFGLQSGLMGNGWSDVIRPAVWRAFPCHLQPSQTASACISRSLTISMQSHIILFPLYI